MNSYNDYEEYFDYSEQRVTHHQTHGLAFALSIMILVFIYLPLLTIGYIASYRILTPKDSAFTWIGSILFFAGLAYMIIQGLKRKIRPLRHNGNPDWIRLFIFCVALTCVQTPWMLYQPISHFCANCHWPYEAAWALDIGIGIFIYYRYDFLG